LQCSAELQKATLAADCRNEKYSTPLSSGRDRAVALDRSAQKVASHCTFSRNTTPTDFMVVLVWKSMAVAMTKAWHWRREKKGATSETRCSAHDGCVSCEISVKPLAHWVAPLCVLVHSGMGQLAVAGVIDAFEQKPPEVEDWHHEHPRMVSDKQSEHVVCDSHVSGQLLVRHWLAPHTPILELHCPDM
jgi:hypothetical protein